MAIQSLDDLKAENAQAELAAKGENTSEEVDTETPPKAVEEETGGGVVENEPAGTETASETGTEETGDDETEAWMQGDGHESQAEKKFTDGDVGRAKQKYGAKLEKKFNAELEAERQEKERLAAQVRELQNQKPTDLSHPKREDYYDKEDPEGAYLEALADYKVETRLAEAQARTSANQLEQQQAEQQRVISQSVDQHYDRVAELAEKSNISPDTYRNAELNVRAAVDAVIPEGGDLITDAFISRLGEGSERVLYNLGINTSRRNEFQKRLQSDPSGIDAAMYLAELKAKLTTPSKRQTNAPKPAAELKGDGPSGQNKTLKKRYDAAHKSGDGQVAFQAKMEAKKQGVDTSTW